MKHGKACAFVISKLAVIRIMKPEHRWQAVLWFNHLRCCSYCQGRAFLLFKVDSMEELEKTVLELWAGFDDLSDKFKKVSKGDPLF
jgi:hypothetical protein